jgi:hypothetical protein
MQFACYFCVCYVASTVVFDKVSFYPFLLFRLKQMWTSAEFYVYVVYLMALPAAQINRLHNLLFKDRKISE